MRTRSGTYLAVLLLLAGGPARAALITSAAEVPGPATVIDFSQFTTLVFTAGPVQIGGLVGEDVVWTATNPGAGIGTRGFPGYGLGANGFWNVGRGGFTGLNAGIGTMTYTFNSGPVSDVGALLNYVPGGSDVIIAALDAGGNVLESYNISALAPISTPGQTNQGGFRGIVRADADIARFTVSNATVALDDLTFSRVVPEPSALTLLGLGGLGLAGYAWRRRKQAA
jgi:hypothetical protein